MICSYSNIVQSVILDMEAMILVWKTFYIMYQHVRNKKLSLSPCYISQLQCVTARGIVTGLVSDVQMTSRLDACKHSKLDSV